MTTTVRPRIGRVIPPRGRDFLLSESWRRRLPLLPALLFLILLTQVPFVMSIWYSLTDWKVVPPGPREFIGLDNYSHLASDHFFRDAVWVSVRLTVIPVLGSLALGS